MIFFIFFPRFISIFSIFVGMYYVTSNVSITDVIYKSLEVILVYLGNKLYPHFIAHYDRKS